MNNRISNLNKVFLLILVLLFSLNLGLFLGKGEITNFFLLSNLANAKSSLSDSNGVHIIPGKFAPGYDMMLSLIHIILNIPLIQVAFIPIGLMIVPVAYLALIRKISRNYWIAIISIFYIISDMAQTGWYSTFAYVWARTIYLMFILLFLRILREGKNARLLFVLFLMFIGEAFIHYTPPGWIILFVSVVYLFERYWIKERHSDGIDISFILFLVVSYLTISQILYQVFIPSFANMVNKAAYIGPIFDFLASLQSYIFSRALTLEKYAYYPSWGLYGVTRVLISFLLLFPILLSLPELIHSFLRIPSSRKKESSNISKKFAVYFALLVTIIVQAVIYGIMFNISHQFLLFMGPVIATLAFSLLKNKRFRSTFFMFLFSLSILSLLTSFPHLADKPHFSFIEPSGKWLMSTAIEGEPRVLASGDKRFYYSYIFSDFNKRISIFPFTLDTYEMLLLKKNLEEIIPYNYIFLGLDEYYKGVIVEGLNFLEPLSVYSEEINNNPNLCKIYDNGFTWIFRT